MLGFSVGIWDPVHHGRLCAQQLSLCTVRLTALWHAGQRIYVSTRAAMQGDRPPPPTNGCNDAATIGSNARIQTCASPLSPLQTKAVQSHMHVTQAQDIKQLAMMLSLLSRRKHERGLNRCRQCKRHFWHSMKKSEGAGNASNIAMKKSAGGSQWCTHCRRFPPRQ